MRPSVIQYLSNVLRRYQAKSPVYEMGSFIVPGQGHMSVRSLFTGMDFIGCDVRAGNGVDKIENVECLTLKDNSAGTVLCLDTLEHVENVHNAMKEMYRVVVPGGLVIITSVFYFKIHDFPYDYWRFTPKAFELLLKPFSKSEVTSDGSNSLFPVGVYGFGIK